MTRTLLLAAAAATAMTAGIAMAKDGQRGAKIFERLDINGDGAISASESESFRAERVARMDANGDGRVTIEEMREAGRKRRADRTAKRFEKMDANGDGVVQRAEFEDMAAKRFDRMDANGDGQVTIEEIRARKGRRKGG